MFETSYSRTYAALKNHQLIYPEIVLLHSIDHSEWALRSAVCLVRLLGISFQIILDLNDMVARTRNRRISGNAHQCDVAVNTLQALAVGNGPTVISPPSMTYHGILLSDSPSSLPTM